MVVAVTVAAAGQAAQPDASLSLTLDEAIRLGVDQSDRIEEANARGEGAAAAVDERRAASLPQFAAQAGYTRTNHVQQFGVLLPNTYQPSPRQGRRSSPSGRRVKKTRGRKK
jgi:outer membrane protein TolC